jgi:hypothetical protein
MKLYFLSAIAALVAIVTLASRPGAAEWLVLQGGRRIQTEGPWQLNGDLLTVHEPSGRVLAVAAASIDAASCLRTNSTLRIVTSPHAMGKGEPTVVRQIWPQPLPNPAIPASPENRSLAAESVIPTGAPLPAKSPSPRLAEPTDASPAARQRARQAEMHRELEYRQILDGCARMFVLDRAGFKRCVVAQTQPAQ